MHRLSMIVTMALVVIGLRAFPFLLFGRGRKVPRLLLFLGNVMTGAAIAMLVVYSLYGVMDYAHAGFSRWWALGAAAAVTVGMHLLFKSPLVSIVLGTMVYMAIVQNCFCLS